MELTLFWMYFHNLTSIKGDEMNFTSPIQFRLETSDDTCKYVKHDWLTAKFVLNSICGTSIAFLGIAGNIITIFVLTRPTMRTPNNLYLTFLAIFDSLLLISAVCLYSIEYIYEYTDNLTLYTIWLMYVRHGFALSHVAQTGSVYITVAVTFERYLAVLYPKRAKTVCTHDRASFAIIVVTAFAILFNSTKYFELEVIYRENCTGFGAQLLAPSALLNDEVYTTVHSLWLTQSIMVFIPFVVLFAANSAIVYRVKRSLKMLSWIERGRKRDELKEKSKDATRVLIVIVLVFLLCNSIGFVLTLLENLYTQEGLSDCCPDFYAFAREAVNFLAIVNSSINFIIYLVFGQDFRRELVSVRFCKRFIVMVPTGDKFTAEGLMINSTSSRRRPSTFARYIGLIRQTSSSQMFENGRARVDRPWGSMVNLKGMVASVHWSKTDSKEKSKKIHRVGAWENCESVKSENHADKTLISDFLSPPLERKYFSHSDAILYSSQEEIKDKRCLSEVFANGTDKDKKSILCKTKAKRKPEADPLAPFLLGMLIPAPAVKQVRFDKVIKTCERV